MMREISEEEKTRAREVSKEMLADLEDVLGKYAGEIVGVLLVVQLEAADSVMVGGGEEPGPRGRFMGELRGMVNQVVGTLSQGDVPLGEGSPKNFGAPVGDAN